MVDYSYTFYQAREGIVCGFVAKFLKIGTVAPIANLSDLLSEHNKSFAEFCAFNKQGVRFEKNEERRLCILPEIEPDSPFCKKLPPNTIKDLINNTVGFSCLYIN